MITFETLHNAYTGMTSGEISRLKKVPHAEIYNDIKKINETYEKLDMPTVQKIVYKLDGPDPEEPGFLLTHDQVLDLFSGYSLDLHIEINKWYRSLIDKD